MLEVLKQAREALLTCEWVDDDDIGHAKYDAGKIVDALVAIDKILAQPEQEPVTCDCNQGQVCHVCDPITPPQRKQLTTEQVEKIIKTNMMLQMNFAGIRHEIEEVMSGTEDEE